MTIYVIKYGVDHDWEVVEVVPTRAKAEAALVEAKKVDPDSTIEEHVLNL
jgi:hypothetical protein